MDKIITVPFGYLLDWLYQFTTNYGVALILFAIIVQVVLLPITAKSKRSMMKMSRLNPRMKEIQAKYAGDQQKQNEAMQALYKEEGVSMGGGCLWSFVPLLILIPLYSVVRQPIVYMLHETAETAAEIVNVIKTAAPDLFGKNNYYDEILAAAHIPEFVEAIKEKFPEISQSVLDGVNFNFLGLDLGRVPSFSDFKFDWAHVGLMVIPLMSAGQQVLSMWLSQKMNNSVVTDEKGIQDEQAAKESQANQTSKVMMWTMPLMSLWIGFTVPVALSLYWFVGGVVRMVEDLVLTKHYRKIYDAEDAERLRKAMEQDAIEAEKERVRAERRAANPEGQTQNTSKKKLQKQQKAEEEAAKAAAAKEYAAKKGVAPEQTEEKTVMSGISSRPYCKGRAYDPNRYSGESTEE